MYKGLRVKKNSTPGIIKENSGIRLISHTHTSNINYSNKNLTSYSVFAIFTITLNGVWLKNETPSQGQVVLAEMNVILWGYNECHGI